LTRNAPFIEEIREIVGQAHSVHPTFVADACGSDPKEFSSSSFTKKRKKDTTLDVSHCEAESPGEASTSRQEGLENELIGLLYTFFCLFFYFRILGNWQISLKTHTNKKRGLVLLKTII
jgi:hypothetical protein